MTSVSQIVSAWSVKLERRARSSVAAASMESFRSGVSSLSVSSINSWRFFAVWLSRRICSMRVGVAVLYFCICSLGMGRLNFWVSSLWVVGVGGHFMGEWSGGSVTKSARWSACVVGRVSAIE